MPSFVRKTGLLSYNYLTVAINKTRTTKDRTVAFTVTNTTGFFASSLQKFPTGGCNCNGSRRSAFWFPTVIDFFLSSNPSVHELVHKSGWSQTYPPWYAALWMCSGKKNSCRRNYITMPLLPGKQFTSCLASYLSQQKRPLHLKNLPLIAKLTSSLPYDNSTKCHSHWMHGRKEEQLHKNQTHLICHVQEATKSIYSFHNLSTMCST